MQAQPPHDDLHPQISRFAAETCNELSPAQAANILGCHEDSVRRLCTRHALEHSVLNARGNGDRITYKITKAALLTWMIRNTHGPREIIIGAIAARCPRWLKFAQAVVRSSTVPHEPRPANVIAFGHAPVRKAKATILPFEHPDLFEKPASQASA